MERFIKPTLTTFARPIFILVVTLAGISFPVWNSVSFASTMLAVSQEFEEKPNDGSKKNDSHTSTVGFPKQILQHKITGSKVIVKPITERTETVIVRIIETYPHGSDFRYDLEYKGLEPGEFDLADNLIRENQSDEPIASLNVQINPILPPEKVRPTPLTGVSSGYRSFYFPLLVLLGVVWVAGLFFILFYGRPKRVIPVSEQPRKTVAECLRPLVDAAMKGELSTEQQAELERLLSAHWSKKLGLEHLSADQLRTQLREHDEASVMLNQIDHWLHRPTADESHRVDVNELLKPYSNEY